MGKNTGYLSIDKPQNKDKKYLERNPFVPNMNIFETIKVLSTFYRGREAVDCLDLSADYNKLLDDAVTISLALKELGVKEKDIVTVSMPNFYQAVATFLACNRIGAITTFLNSFEPEEEIYDYLNLFSSPVFINFDKTKEENIKTKRNTNVRHIITLRKSRVNSLDLFGGYDTLSDDTIDFNYLGNLSKFQKKEFERKHGIKEDSLILFTSGTTGKPKSVVLTNENILYAGTYLKNSSNIRNISDKRTLVCVPFTYPYGFATSTLMTLLSGKTAILAPNIGLDTINYYLDKKPNMIFGSPALLELIMRNVEENKDLSFIRTFISGGDFLTPENNRRGQEFFKKHNASVEIGNGSGNAETVSCGTNPVGIEIKPETAGKILAGTDAMIVDPETMEELKYGEEGLLCVSGKHVFKEYYKRPDLTSEAKFERNGKTYFKTGTMGFVTEDGYFTITGRQSRFYIMSTLNKVYLDRIQNIISKFPNVLDCAIVKVPDKDKLYVNKAYIVLESNADITTMKEEILARCKEPVEFSNGDTEQLKEYEIPTYIEFVSELPRKKGTEKIDYTSLEEDALKEIEKPKVYVKK